ncbi:MAG: Nif3-like dinuclear metal center hexameric protein [Planctomycetes bacterium]|nr:Nif3-like dinuclear metal center hexameric protein [Planctomycetota bacterium]
MATVQDVSDFLEGFAPSRLAEDWDNVGLLVGDPSLAVQRVMTCLTVTPGSANEATREGVDLIISHHPLPFRPVKRLTTETVPGRLLWQLIRDGVSIYSPHTRFDSAAMGINQSLAEGLGLTGIQPLVPDNDQNGNDDPNGLGAGRFGRLHAPLSLTECADRLKKFLAIEGLHVVGPTTRSIHQVAVACGSAGSFLEVARRKGCDLLITGETTFHTCLEAEATDIALLLPGHYASERFAVELLADVLVKQFSDIEVWASRDEADPLRWI